MQIKNVPEPRLKVFINFLCELALLGKCTDKKNAAILCDERMGQIYSIGLNGGPKHGVDCLCSLGLKYTCIHAEAQALMKAPAPSSLSEPWRMMLCTMSPCVTCASLMINYGIHKVVYVVDYKNDDGIKLLIDAGCEVFKYVDETTLINKNAEYAAQHNALI